MSLVPYVIEQTSRGERSYDIYSRLLKDRIMSEHGHLCNEDSAYAALDIIGEDTKEIYLAHLSEEANTPEKALEAYNDIFSNHGVNPNIKITCLHQWHSTTGGNYEN